MEHNRPRYSPHPNIPDIDTGQSFPIVTILDNRFQTRLITLIRTQVESRTTSMACHDERQPTQPVSRKITTFGIDAQHTVRQMDGRISRHQQMADVPHIRVNIFYRFFRQVIGDQPFSFDIIPIGKHHDGNSDHDAQ